MCQCLGLPRGVTLSASSSSNISISRPSSSASACVAFEEGDARPADPAVARPVPLAAEAAAGRQRFANPRPQLVKSLRLAKRHGEARIHQLHAERQRHFLESGDDRRDALGVGQLARGELAQRLGLGIDGDDAPAASQNFDDVASVAAAEIDRQRIGGRFAERVERSQQRPARRSVAQLLRSRRPIRRMLVTLRLRVMLSRQR